MRCNERSLRLRLLVLVLCRWLVGKMVVIVGRVVLVGKGAGHVLVWLWNEGHGFVMLFWFGCLIVVEMRVGACRGKRGEEDKERER